MTINGKTPENLEEQAISLVGTDIYEKLIKDYTEKDRTLSLLRYHQVIGVALQCVRNELD